MPRFLRFLPILLSVLALARGHAVELTATVVRIADGDTLSVRAMAGLPPEAKRGRDGDVYIRLLCVDTLEIWDESRPRAPEGEAARAMLERLAAPGSKILLADSGPRFELDPYGRVLAFVRPVDATLTAQESLITAGLSAYWRRWRIAPEPLNRRLEAAEAEARRTQAGAWRTQAELMTRKSAERPRGPRAARRRRR
jgi:endonuclease YncB( thermonuclease family)